MVNSNNMLFIRPRNCHDCGNGYYGLLHAVQYAQNKNLWNITDLDAEEAEKTIVYENITDTDPQSIYGFGHGLPYLYTGDSETEIWSTTNCNNVAGRFIYLMSCLTGQQLGPEMIQKGAMAYAGFNISWTWITEASTEGDPYNDKYAKCFWESANALWIALCDGYEFMEAVDKSVAKYNEWIDYWFANSNIEGASECITWLIVDRDGLVAYDACMLKKTEDECVISDCYWYSNKCNSRLQKTAEGTFNIPILPLVLVATIVGLFLVTSKKPTKKYKS